MGLRLEAILKVKTGNPRLLRPREAADAELSGKHLDDLDSQIFYRRALQRVETAFNEQERTLMVACQQMDSELQHHEQLLMGFIKELGLGLRRFGGGHTVLRERSLLQE